MEPAAVDNAVTRERAALLVVSPFKFVAMSLCTFGLYEVYWAYRMWRYVRDRNRPEIWPFWRAVFYPLWYYSLLGELAVRVPALESAGRRAGLAAAVLGLNALWRLPDPWWLVSFLTFIPFLPVVVPLARPDPAAGLRTVSGHRPANFVAYALGAPMLAFVALSSIGFLPRTSVIPGSELWDRDLAYLQEAGILAEGERIIYFYSAGLLSIREDGQFFSDDYVTSYWRDPATDETHLSYASYLDIDDIRVEWAETLFDSTVVTIVTSDGGEFQVWLSSEGSGDTRFVDRMRQNWNRAKQASGTEP